jgi:MFS family permease
VNAQTNSVKVFKVSQPFRIAVYQPVISSSSPAVFNKMAAALWGRWRWRWKAEIYNVSDSSEARQDDFELSVRDPEVSKDEGIPEKCTVEEAVERIGCGLFQVLVISFAGGLWIVEAFEILLLSMLTALLMCKWGLSSFEEALLTSMVFVGFQIGAPFWGYVADRYGRKRTLVVVAGTSATFGVLSALSPSYGWMVFLRTMLGVTAAGNNEGVILCIEYLPKKARATAIMLLSFYWVVGAIGIVALGWLAAPLGWRWLVGLAAVPYITVALISPIAPRSARFLVLSGKKKEALRNLNLAARLNCRPKLNVELLTDEEMREFVRMQELKEIEQNEDLPSDQDLSSKDSPPEQDLSSKDSPSEQDLSSKDSPSSQDLSSNQELSSDPDLTLNRKASSIQEDLSNQELSLDRDLASNQEILVDQREPSNEIRWSSWRSVMKDLVLFQLFKEGMWKTTLLLFPIWMLVVGYYFGIILVTTVIFQYDKHCSLTGCVQEELDVCKSLTSDDYGALMWTTLAEAPGTVVTILLMPFFGRKLVMGVEMVVIVIFTALLFVCANRIVLIVFIFVCRGLISGVYQVLFVYTPEVYPTKIRALGLGMCVTAGRIGAITSPFIAQVLFQASDIAGIITYILASAVCVVLIVLLPIETKGRTLKES